MTAGTLNVTVVNPSPGAATSNAMSIMVINAASITATGGASQSTAIGTAFGSPLQSMVTDGTNPLAAALVTFTAPPQTTASGTFAGGVNTAVTDATGVATASTFTANTIVGGPYMVTATTGALAANFSLTNTAATAGTIMVSGVALQTTALNTPFSQPLLARVADNNGNPIKGAMVTFAVPGSGASATITGGNTSMTDAGGVAVSGAVTANGTSGTYTINATVGGVVGSAMYSMTNLATVAPISTVAGGGTGLGHTNTCGGPFIGGIFNGNYYVQACFQIYTVTPGGVWTLIAGNGTVGYSGDGGPATQAALNPLAIFVDGSGNVFIVDSANNRIREVFATGPMTGMIQTVAGNGTPGYNGDNISALSAELNFPSGVYVDSSGNIYISDSGNNLIRKVSGGIITTLAGIVANVTNPNCGGLYNGTPGAATNVQLCFPEGIWLDGSKNVYFADNGFDVIRKIDTTNTLTTVAGGDGIDAYNGDGISATSAELGSPNYVFVDGPGNIFIPDYDNQRVREVTAANGIINTIAGNGVFGYAGDLGPAISARTSQPYNVFGDSSGNIYFSDDAAVREIVNATKNIQTVIGNSAFGFSGDGGKATSAQLFYNSASTVDANGNIFIADLGNYRIREVVAATGNIQTIAGNGTNGSTGDGGPATSAGVGPVRGVAVDSNGNVYFTEAPFSNSDTIACRVRKILMTANPPTISTVAGGATCGFGGDGGAATSAQLTNLSGLAVDSSGNIFIAQGGGHSAIREVFATGPMTGMIQTVAGNGTRGYNGDGIPATTAALNNPRGVAVDAFGNIYIADTNNNRVREVVGGIIVTVAGNGTFGYSGDGGSPTNALIAQPFDVAVDSFGDIFIAQTGGIPAVREVVASSGLIETVAGTGILGFAGDGGPATSAQLAGSGNIALDSSGNLYINNAINARVRFAGIPPTGILTITPASPVTFPDTVVGNESAPLALTLKNTGPTGASSITLTNVNLTPKTPIDFIGAPLQSGDCGYNGMAIVLAVGQSCTLRGEFTPTTTGLRSATLTITATGAMNSPVSITLQGTGTPAAGPAIVSANPNPINFPDQNVGTTSMIVTSVITNTGTGSATLTKFNASGSTGDFAIVTPQVAGDCTIGAVLAPGGSPGNTCYIRETFTPLGTGPFQAIGKDTFTNVSAPLSVTANGNGATPTSMGAISGSVQSTAINTPFALPLVAQLTDGNSKPIAGVTVTFTAPGSGASGTFAGTPPTTSVMEITDGNGLATTPIFTANGTPGANYNVMATAGVLNAGFFLTNTSTATNKLAFTTQPGGGTAGMVWAQQPVVTVQTPGGSTDTTSSAPITLVISGGTGASGATLTCTSNPVNASSGVATFAGCKIDKAASGYTLTATSTGLTSTISSPFTIAAGAAASIAPTAGSGQSTTVGTVFAMPLEATVTDTLGNPVPNTPVTFTAPPQPGASGTFPGSATSAVVSTDTSGVATAPSFTANATVGGPYTVTAKAGAIGPANFSLTNLTNGLQIVLSTNTFDFGNQTINTTSLPQTVVLTNNGAAATITNIQFAAGNTDFAAAAQAPGDCSKLIGMALGFAANASCNLRGTFTPTAVGFRSTTLTITTSANSPVLTLQGTGVASAAASLKVSGYPSPTNTGTANNFTVTALDALNNSATGYRGTLHFTSSDAQAVLPANYTFTAADNGTHTFSATFKTAGTQSLTATDTVTASITGSQTAITVNAATAASLKVSGYPNPATAGTANNFTVTALDALNNTATGYRGTVHFTSTDAQAVLPADYTFTAADNGTHTFSATFKTAGTQSLAATDTVTASITGSQTAVTVNAATAASLKVSGYPNPATAGTANNFTVTALDALNNTATAYRGTVHFTSSDAQAVLPANYTFTPADNGTHTFSATLKSAGTQSLTATDTVTASITGSQTAITVNAATAASLKVSGYPNPATAGAANNFTVTALDALNNTSTGYRGTVHFTSSDAQAVLPADYTFVAADNGVHQFSATLKTAGTQSLTATDTATATITGSQASINVTAGAATKLTVSGYPSPVAAGTANNFTVTAFDAFNNTATGYRGTVKFTSSDAQAVVPANYPFVAADNGVHQFSATLKTAGTQSLTATDTVTAAITGSQASIKVTAGAATKLTVSGYPSPVAAGTANNFTVTALDAFNNTATGYVGTVHFTSSDAQAVVPANYPFAAADNGVHQFSATLKTAGTQSLTATDTVTAAITGSQAGISVTAGAATKLTVSGFPSPVAAGTANNFTVTALDAFNNTAKGYVGTVHFTSSDAQAVVPANYPFVA
ncbi:MAG TPA: choice-of-anchor D domain-containing protein, partial [Candidatus Acidoferrales bacterium]|nr:choice-of-anchor D domain-containing protein [Candidatus Acidoferrales bacterium]